MSKDTMSGRRSSARDAARGDPGGHGYELTSEQTLRALAALTNRTDRWSAHHGLASSSSYEDSQTTPSDALARILLRGSSSAGPHFVRRHTECQPVIERFTSRLTPIHIIMIGFPYKQYDNGLRAAGPYPDVAEVAELLRLRGLQNLVKSQYPPGLRVSILSDGGYHHDGRDAAAMAYSGELKRLLKLTAVDDFVRVMSLDSALRRVIGADTWRRRGCLVHAIAHQLQSAVEPARARYSTIAAFDRLRRRGLIQPGLPSFTTVLNECLQSAAVPGQPDDQWVRTVLHAVFDLDVLEPLRTARVAVLEQAWRDALYRLATTIVDHRLGIFDRLPPHVRIEATLSDETPPWHGTGYVDGSGRISTARHEALIRKGYKPVHSRLLAPGQPWTMVEPDLFARAGSEPFVALLKAFRPTLRAR